MPNCILCDRPIPTPQTEHKRGKDLVCAACNSDILKQPADPDQADDGQPEITAAVLKRINALEARSKELYEMIETDPEYCGKSEEMVSNLPKIIQAYVMTPVKSYKMMQFLIAIAKGEYVDSIIKEGSDLRLEKIGRAHV